ncbi:MAG: glycosyltransferase family 2 protein [Hyphomonadaceae bacterium]
MTISVIMAVYNAEGFVERALKSAMNQTCNPHIIIVDDASTDGTVDTVRELIADYPKATLVRQQVNAGPAAARNQALKLTQTEWVTPLDADDEIEPDRLEKMIAIANDRRWDAIADDQIRVNSWEEGAPSRRLWSDEDFGMMDLSLARFVRENIMTHTGLGRELGYIKPLIRTDFLRDNDLYYNENMRLGEDYDLYCRIMARGGRFGLVDPMGYIAHEMAGSLSRSHRPEDLRQVLMADRRLLNMRAISPDARKFLHEHAIFSHKKWAWARMRDAYHNREFFSALACFAAPPQVVMELFSLLGEQFEKRIKSL